MFQFTKQRLVRDWPATITVAQDGGSVSSHHIGVDLEIIDTEHYRTVAAQGDRAVIAAIVKGWHGIGDEHGEPLPFNDDNRDALASHSGFTTAVLTAYLQAARGEAAQKNS